MSEKVNIKPLGDRMVVKPIEAEAVSEGGIVLAGEDAQKPHEGEVWAIAPDCKNVAVGDKVLFGGQVGQEVEVQGNTFRILSEDEIIAILV